MNPSPRPLRLLFEVSGISLHAAEVEQRPIRMARTKGQSSLRRRRCEERSVMTEPALLAFVDTGYSTDESWLAMEWVAGPTLEDWSQLAAVDPTARSPAVAAWVIARLAESLRSVNITSTSLPAGPLVDIVLGPDGRPRFGHLGELSDDPRTTEGEQVVQLLRWLQRLCGRERPDALRRVEEKILSSAQRLAALADALDELALQRTEFACTRSEARHFQEQLLRRSPIISPPSLPGEVWTPPPAPVAQHPVPSPSISQPNTSQSPVVTPISASAGLSSDVVVGAKYRLVRLLGGGATGQVYEGLSIANNHRVAIKIIQQKGANAASLSGFTERFRREAHAMAQLNHPNIVAVHDFGHEDFCWLAMELIDGPSLATYLAPQAKMNVEDTLTVGRQLCAALGHAHSRGIIHRDIKPANVLVRNTSPFEVKLADFGLAKSWVDEDYTMDGSLVGTPHYMSPEQCLGQPATAASDTYALGVLLFRLLTGKVPFEGRSGAAVLNAHINQLPPTIAEIDAALQVPEALEDVLARALTKVPQERFLDASEFDAALAWCQVCLRPDRSTPAPIARPRGANARGATTKRRAPLILFASVAALMFASIVCVLVLALWSSGLNFVSASPAPVLAEPPAPVLAAPPAPAPIPVPASAAVLAPKPDEPDKPAPEPKVKSQPLQASASPKSAPAPAPAPAPKTSSDLKNPFQR